MIRVGALFGSMRVTSLSRRALDIALEGVAKAGVPAEVVELGRPALPLLEEGVTDKDPAVVAFRDLVRSCDALLVSTPVYHDSFSGALKNALDLLYDELSDKVIGLVAVGGGSTGQGQALEHLRSVFRETGSWVIPRQVAIAKAKEMFDPATNRPKDPELDARLVRLGQEVVLRCRQLRPKRAPPAAAT